MKRIIAILSLSIISAFVSQAQIKVDAPTVVGLQEQFNITFSLSEKPSSFEWAPSDAFQLVWGPQTGSSTSISIVNGKTTRSSQYTYTYVVLPRLKGSFAMPAAHAVVDGNDVYSKSLKIEVVGDDSQSSSSRQPSQSASGQSSSSSGSTPSSDIFMRFSLSRTNVVLGEPITATLKLYTRANISGFEDARFPSFNGFWAQEIESPQNINFQRESVGDKIYNSAVLRRWVIIPQKTGAVNIDSAELVCLLQQRVSSGNSIFDGFFDDFQTIRKRIVSTSYTVNVSPLPSGAPASFTGAVGSYRISASLGKDSLKVHDAASLTVTVSGKGNVSLIGAPKVKFPADSEVYDTKITDRMEKGSGGTSGTKIFEYPFIPRSHGDFKINPVEFSYFDIASRKYVTLRTEAIPYSVAMGDTSDYVTPSGINIPVNVGKDVKNLSEDIHFITTKLPVFSTGDGFFAGTGLFWSLIVLLSLLATAVYFVISHIRSTRSNVALVRTKGASKAARKRLALAGDYLSKNLHSAFYEELHKALLGYASDKLTIGGADLSKDAIAAAFLNAGAPESLVSEYVSLIDKCEFARYAPEESNEGLQQSYDNAMTIISSIDANMKKTSNKTSTAVSAIVIAICSGFCATAEAADASPDSLWNRGVTAFSAQQFEEASDSFRAIEELGYVSPELYTNIADSFLKSRNLGMAVLYYERALKLDPSFKDARYNLEIAKGMCQDRIESVPEFFLKSVARKLCYRFSSNIWAWAGIGFFALALAMVLLFLLSSTAAARKTGFFSAIAVTIVCLVCIFNAFWQKDEFLGQDKAVVTRTVTSAKSTPSETSGSDLFILHEGTVVNILENVGEWTNVSIADGREGWVLCSDISII